MALAAYGLKAQTNVGGIISTNTTWDLAGSPYVLTSNILVDNNIVLTIEPGVEIHFMPGQSDEFTVRGSIQALGTDNDPILFTSGAASPTYKSWKRLYITDQAIPYNASTGDGNILQHCIFRYGGNIPSPQAPVVINSPTILDGCLFDDPDIHPFQLNTGNMPEPTYIINNRFENGRHYANMESEFLIITNNILKNTHTPYIDPQNAKLIWGDKKLVFSHNQILDSEIVHLRFGGDTVVFTNNVISGNIFESFQVNAYIVSMDIGDSSLVECNIYADNQMDASYFVHVYGHHVRNNQFIDNGGKHHYYVGGPKTTYNTFRESSRDTLVNWNNEYLALRGDSAYGNNFFYENPSISPFYYITNGNLITSNDLQMPNNYLWGETSNTAIDNLLYDFFDNSNLSILYYNPPLAVPDINAPISPPSDVTALLYPNGDMWVTWSPNPESDVAGYKVYWDRNGSYDYGQTMDVGNQTYFIIPNMTLADTIGVTAYDTQADGNNDLCEGHESWFTLAWGEAGAPSAGPDQSICIGTNNCITIGTPSQPVIATYDWQPAASLSDPSIAQPLACPTVTTTYHLTMTDTNSNITTDSMIVYAYAAPINDAGPDSAICLGDSLTLQGTPDASYTYMWSPSTGLSSSTVNNPIAFPSNDVRYYLTVTDSFGCTSSDSLDITVHSLPMANAGSDTSVCAGDAITLSPAFDPANTYLWSPGLAVTDSNAAQTTTAPPASIGLELMVTNPSGCVSSDSLYITVNALPQADAGNNNQICVGNCAIIGGMPAGPPNAQFSWSPPSGISNPSIPNPMACPFTTTTYYLTVTDTNGCTDSDSTTIVMQPNPIADAGVDAYICNGDTPTLGGNPTGPAGANYTWQPNGLLDDTTAANPMAFVSASTQFTVTVTDASGCVAVDTVMVFLDTACVWPGDANYNGIADAWDALSIGVAFNSTGPARPNASTNWEGQYADAWSGTFASGRNYKHADCDGDGQVDWDDQNVILLNYGLTHSKHTHTFRTANLDSALYLVGLNDSVKAGDTATVQLILGDNLPLTVYGLAFRLHYDKTLVDSASLKFDFSNSWLGTEGVDMLTLTKDFYSLGHADVALSRIDQQDATGNGQIASFQIIMIDDVAGKDLIAKTFAMDISNLLVIDHQEQIVPLSQSGDSIVVWQEELTNSIIEPVSQDFRLFPNPAHDQVTLVFDHATVAQVSLTDITGRTCHRIAAPQADRITVNTSALPAGMYFVVVETGNGVMTKKLILY